MSNSQDATTKCRFG